MMGLFRLLPAVVVRYLLRHRLIAVFNVLSIALGVAVYLAIQIANHSANRSFNAGIDLVAGRSHLEVSTSGNVPAEWYGLLRSHPEVEAATPIVAGYATLPEHSGKYLKILGVDVFSNAPFSTYQINAANGAGIDWASWLREPRTVGVMPGMLETLNLNHGDSLDLLVNGRAIPVTLGASLTSEEDGLPENTALMDIGWAQELLGVPHHISSIQLRVKTPENLDQVIETLQKVLPADANVETPAVRNSQVQKMLQGFQLNLTALSMVSVLVGIYLIYNTVSASVVRRRREIGILRAMGTDSAGIRALFLSEAAVMGVLGIAVGIFGGIWLGSALLSEVARTVSTHYILLSIDQSFVSPVHIIQAAAYGLGATLLGAWLPAKEAATTDPAEVLHQGHLQNREELRSLPWFFTGLVLLGISAWMAWQSLQSGPAWLSFGSCFLVMVAFSLMVSAFSKLFAAVFLSVVKRVRSTAATLARVAVENFRRALHRSSVTVAALMVAIAMMVGVSVMISSFRSTIGVWMNQVMVADVYIAPASQELLGSVSYAPADLGQLLMEVPGVNSFDTHLDVGVDLSSGARYALSVIDGGRRGNIPFVGGGSAEKVENYFKEDHVLITEILSGKEGLETGDRVSLVTPNGKRSFTVAGIYYDYTSNVGKVTMSRQNYDRYWPERRFHSVALFYEDEGADLDEIKARLDLHYGGKENFSIFSNREIRRRILEIFDQTFSITYVLRSISVLVAIFGIILTLTTLVMERVREIAIFRAIGASRWQVMHAYLMEAGLIGLVSSLIGVVAGLALSMVLTWVVNKAFFGWSIQFQIPWGDLALVPVWVTLVAVLAGVIPALRAGQTMISEAVRAE